MYNYGASKADSSTRIWGLGIVAGVTGGLAIALITMRFTGVFEEKKSEVAIIDVEEEIVEEPPPPPPVDIELPPPPPMVVVPEFQFDVPPPPAAIQQVAPAVERPAAPPAPPAAKPAPPPAPTLRSKPKPGRRFKKPEYPAAARRAGETGVTTVSACVDIEGKMTNVQLVRSSGSTRLDEAALKALNNNRLEPAIGSDGKPIAMCNPPYVFSYEWTLEDN
jgi:protein TonB